MKVLNLVNIHQSNISYKITNFPDGQQDILITTQNTAYIKAEPVQIKSRFNSFQDLEIIICVTKALRRLGVKQISLYIPYLLGSRSDRQFQEGGTSYLVDVIAPILNAQNFESVTVLDVHSDVASACIENLIVVKNLEFAKSALTGINNKNQDVIFISPDGGSLKKIYKVAEYVHFKGDIITCSKDRDTDGNLTKTVVPMGDLWSSDKDLVIIDDICDGGRTFINIAKECKKGGYKGKIFLVITHGIFSAGLKDLSEYFDMIYTTNSIMDINVDTEFWAHNDKYIHKVTQINIF
jgi:ribose-phosphate pyrophosphokinase